MPAETLQVWRGARWPQSACSKPSAANLACRSQCCCRPGLPLLDDAATQADIAVVEHGGLAWRDRPLLVTEGGDPEALAAEKGLFQQNDEGALEKMAQEVIVANPTVVAEFKGGKDSSLMFLVGQIMKASKGSANPQKI